MADDKAPPIAIEHMLPDFSREFLAHAGMLFGTNGKVNSNTSDNTNFEHHLDSHAVGKVVAEHLPEDMKHDLRVFFSRQGPPVMVLRNFPTIDESASTKHILEGLIYTMTMGYGDGEKALDDKPRRIATNLHHHNRYGTETQRYHYDGPEDNPVDIVMLACIKEGGDNIATCFSRNSLEGFSTDGSAADAVKVHLRKGDIVLFRNREIMHGRQNLGRNNAEDRLLRSVDMNTFVEQKPPEGWVKLVHQRAQELMKPPGK